MDVRHLHKLLLEHVDGRHPRSTVFESGDKSARFDQTGAATYDAALLPSCRESGLDTVPVIARMDFGHTDPMLTIPYGIEAEIDVSVASCAS